MGVKMKNRYIAGEQRRDAERMRLLKEEESIISKMRVKLERRKKKEERKKRDRERMEKGNRELVRDREIFKGDESFIGLRPLGSSTQKTVVFDKELTKVRNISPVMDVDEGEPLSNTYMDNRLWFNQADNNGKCTKHVEGKISVGSTLTSSYVESQQVILATQTINQSRPRSRRKAKVRIKSVDRCGDYVKPISVPIRGFDVKLAVKCMLYSNQLSPSEFSLPKEFTSLKLEKIRENKILSLNTTSLSQNNGGIKRMRNFSDDEHSSPKRKVRNSHRTSLYNSPVKGSSSKKRGKLRELDKVLYEKSSDGKFSAIVCISNRTLEVWVSQHDDNTSWVVVAQFTSDKILYSPFICVDCDAIKIKELHVENDQIIETSYVVLGIEGEFSDPITSTQTVLILRETFNIDRLFIEKFDRKQIIAFLNIKNCTRGFIVNYIHDQKELKALATLEGSTQAVKKLIGTEDIFLSLTKSMFYFWNIKSGNCVKTLNVDLVGVRIFKAALVKGNINILHRADTNMRISVLMKYGFKIVASIAIEIPLKTLELNTDCIYSTSSDNFRILFGSWLGNWDIAEKQIKWEKVARIDELGKFLFSCS